MSVVNPSTLYTSRAEMEAIGGDVFIDTRVDDDMDAVVSPAEDADVTEAIYQATDEINAYLLAIYDESELVKSNWVRHRATRLALHFLSLRQGNPGQYDPASIYLDLQRALNQEIRVPRIVPRMVNKPVFSNIYVDRRYRFKSLRVETPEDYPNSHLTHYFQEFL